MFCCVVLGRVDIDMHDILLSMGVVGLQVGLSISSPFLLEGGLIQLDIIVPSFQ